MNLEDLEEVTCNCSICKSYCEHSPGWFLPEQILEVEQHFQKPWRKLLGREVAINYFLGDSDNILVLAPNIRNNNEIFYPFDPRGCCKFYESGECTIYAIRPFECRIADHRDNSFEEGELHRMIAARWLNFNGLRKFTLPAFGFEDYFDLLLNSVSLAR